MHGYNHVYISNNGGINPVNKRSEFAGVDLQIQKEKIRKGYEIFKENNIEPEIFFAPSHTFDKNTLIALKEESNIRIISDTVANNVYFWNGFYFIPQQVSEVRKLPFRVTTFCYHPNNMSENSINRLEIFINSNKNKITSIREIKLFDRKKSIIDKMLSTSYFACRRVRNSGV